MADILTTVLHSAEPETIVAGVRQAQTLARFTTDEFIWHALHRESRGRPDDASSPRPVHDPMAYDSDGGSFDPNLMYGDE